MAARNYFDIHDVLALEEEVPITFHHGVFQLAQYVKPTSMEGEKQTEVSAGSNAVVPLWSAVPLRVSGAAMTRVARNYRSFHDFTPDKLAPSMPSRSMYFYEAGMTLCATLPQHEGLRLRNELRRLFQKRAIRVIAASKMQPLDREDVMSRLSERERCLMQSALRVR